MDAVQRIAQAIMQGQGNGRGRPTSLAMPTGGGGPTSLAMPTVPQISPWELQRLAEAQARGAKTPGVQNPADFAQQAGPQAMGAAMPGAAPPAQVMPPVTAAAPPLPAAAPAPPQAAQAQGMDMSGYASLAVPQAQGAPGMAQMPQTEQQLADWRKLMDAMQYARQGA